MADTATGTDDFVQISLRQLQFNTGDTNGATREVTVDIIDDDIIENSEDFQVKLVVVSGDTISTDTATVTITDDDGEST